MGTVDPLVNTESGAEFDGTLNPVDGLTTQARDRVTDIRKTIWAEDRRLRLEYPILQYQNMIGLAFFSVSLLLIVSSSYLYIHQYIPWYLAALVNALAVSILHEMEHDLIHNLYFSKLKIIQHLMFLVIFVMKQNLNPWIRKELHIRHHRNSGQKTDIEERLIGLGMPFGLKRILIYINNPWVIFSLKDILQDNPDFSVRRMARWSYPVVIPNQFVYGMFALSTVLRYLGVQALQNPTEGFWFWINALFVLFVLPNVIRQASLEIVSSYCHYIDIPKDDVFYQNQIIDSPLMWPLQLFCFNFGATHIYHHYVVNQPFYLRQMIAPVGYAVCKKHGVNTNDWRIVPRNNSYPIPLKLD